MLSEPFSTGNSVIHRVDPRHRILAAFFYSVVVAVMIQLPALAMATVLSGLLVKTAGLDGGAVFRRLALVNGFVALFWLILPFTAKGNILFEAGPFTVYEAGVLLALQITLKSNAIIMAFISLVSTMSFSTLGYALRSLKLPHKLVFLFILTYRYIFVIEQEYRKIWRSVKVRGFSPTTSLHCYKTYAYMIGMIFVRAAARADRVYRAMLCRGFNGRFHSLSDFPASGKNGFFLFLAILCTVLLISTEWYFHG